MSTKCGNVKKVFVPNKKKEAEADIKPVTGVGITDKAARKILHFIIVPPH